MAIFVRESRFLGVSRGRQKYDLPLNKDKGNLFLITLMGLMTFLMILTLVASFVLTAMNERWSTGIEGKASVEISALDQNGAASTQEDVDNFTTQSLEFLNNHPAISNAEQMDKDEIIKLESKIRQVSETYADHNALDDFYGEQGVYFPYIEITSEPVENNDKSSFIFKVSGEFDWCLSKQLKHLSSKECGKAYQLERSDFEGFDYITFED